MILRYTLAEAGMGRIVIGDDDKFVAADVSYEHDSLRDLLAGTMAILEGASQVRVIFMDRPGERYLNIRQLERGRIALQVVWHSGGRSWDGTKWNRDESKGEVRFSCESTVWELRDQVLASCEAIVGKVGVEYLPWWPEREFPLELLERLRAMDLRVRFERGQLVLDCCGQRVRMTASWPRDLLSATAALADGRREGSVRFGDDAREYELSLRRIDDDRVALEVRFRTRGEDNMGSDVFRCETRLERFRAQVLAAAGAPAT